MTDKRKPTAAPEPPVPDAELLSPMLRATVFVRDLEESLTLYRDILGLKPWLERVLDGDRTNRILGSEGKSVRVVILQSGDATTGNVGLFTYDDDQPLPPSRADIRTGDVAFIFITNDIQGIYERVESAGYTIVSPPMVLFPEESAETQSLEMLFFDRDGIAVNLIQRNVPTTLATD
jgi:catechol 2,3-dioxygenase-like lactoylglutathione lyase family enzyme